MGTGIATMGQVYLNYYVIFKAEAPTQPYSPLTSVPFSRSVAEGGWLHGFDPELEGILPGLWYCLHLPRHGLDTMDLSPRVIASGYSVPHNILPMPSYAVPNLTHSNIIKSNPSTLVIGEDSCFQVARSLASDCFAPLGAVPISALSSDLLRQHWAAITQLMQELPKRDSPLQVEPELLLGGARAGLPLSFMANQFRNSQDVLKDLERQDFSQRALLRQAVILRARVSALVELEKREGAEPSADDIAETFDRHLRSTTFSLILTLPGTAPRLRPRGPAAASEVLDRTERSVVNLLGVHRATARSGVWLDEGILSTAFFKELHRLEDHCRASRQNNRFVWESMKRIGKQLAKQLNPDVLAALKRVSHITAFTDFPIGLAILPGAEDPLCCIKPISYRPLTPLTRTLQMELRRVGEIYIGRGFKVVIAECLSRDDRIRPLSDAGWKVTREMLESDPRVEIVYSEVQSVKALRELLSTHDDADILVISAHGRYADNQNFAGLWGDDRHTRKNLPQAGSDAQPVASRLEGYW